MTKAAIKKAIAGATKKSSKVETTERQFLDPPLFGGAGVRLNVGGGGSLSSVCLGAAGVVGTTGVGAALTGTTTPIRVVAGGFEVLGFSFGSGGMT
jgi:hypothetical protein